MTHRNICKEDFVGKTILDLDCEAVNIIRFMFDDGTKLALEVDALGHGIYGMVACEVCASERSPTNTDVDLNKLGSEVKTWFRTSGDPEYRAATEGKDPYLYIVSKAASLSYEEVWKRYKVQDPGILTARTLTKRAIFKRLFNDPASVLQIHDETLVIEPSPVQSKDGPKLED